MTRLCPMAAQACFSGMLLSFPEIPMRCFPDAMAPEVTMTMW